MEDAEYSLRPEDRPQLPAKSLDSLNAAITPIPEEVRVEADWEVPHEQPAMAPASPAVPAHPLPPAAPPRAIAEAITLNWYVRAVTGIQYGPVPGQVVWQWLLENRVGADSLVWREDWPEWLLASSAFVEHFQGALHGSIPVSAGSSPTSSLPRNMASLVSAGSTGPKTPTVQPEKVGKAGLALTTNIPTMGQKNREIRKQKRQRNYTIMIVGLILILLMLLAGLISVLVRQNTGTALISAIEIVACDSNHSRTHV